MEKKIVLVQISTKELPFATRLREWLLFGTDVKDFRIIEAEQKK